MSLAFFQWFTPATKNIHARESCLNASAPFLMGKKKKNENRLKQWAIEIKNTGGHEDLLAANAV